MLFRILLSFLLFSSCFLTPRGLNKQRYKVFRVLEVDEKGNLYFYRTSILCKSEIIKRLTNGTYTTIDSTTPGLSKKSPVLNCKDLKLKVPSATSGVYWIDPDAGSHGNSFQAYCDQKTDGGGWTLVWSYTFTAYASFTSYANAVTPRPNWKAKSGMNTRVSTTVPLSETHYEAMNFSFWHTIGKEILIKSNINNWIACKEGTGSLVREKVGSVSCRLLKQVSKRCTLTVPKSLVTHGCGPSLLSQNNRYYFDGCTGKNWPAHPCGSSESSHLTGVTNPHGNIFIR